MSPSRREFVASLAAGAGALPILARAQELPAAARELWEFVRQQAVVERGLTWLDTAEAGPSLMRVLIEEFRQREARSRNPARYAQQHYAGPAFRQFIDTVSGFLGAQPDEITFTSGVTEAISLVAAGLDFVPDDEIVTTLHEHSAGIYPWLLAARRRGVKVIQVPLPTPLPHPQLVLDTISAAFTPRTRVISFSHVQYTDGSILPVRGLCELARSRGVLSMVDGAQALGMLPVTLRDLGCDFYAANFHKWINGPAGTGVLYLREAARHRVWPLNVAGHDEWSALDRDGTPAAGSPGPRSQWPAAMRKFAYDFQHRGALLRSSLPAIEFHRQIGAARIAARVRELAWYLRMQIQSIAGLRILSSSHPEVWSGIVAFQVPGIDSAELASALGKEGVAVSAVRHAGANFEAVRAATHIYNTHDDADRLARVLRRLAS